MDGNWGYNDKEYFQKADQINMAILNTTTCGPSLPTKFGKTKYATTKDQHDILEKGLLLSLGATHLFGEFTSHLVLHMHGTGQVTLLRSSNRFLSYGHFD